MTRTISMILFAVLFFSVIASVHYYLWIRLIRDAGLPGPWRQISTGVIVALGLSLPMAMFVSRGLPFQTARYLTFVPFIWMGTMMLLFFLFLTVDGFKLATLLYSKIATNGPAVMDPGRRMSLGRLLAGGATLLVGGTTAAAVLGAARQPVLRKRNIGLKLFPGALDGFKLIQISDLHLGITVGKDWLADIVRRVNERNPDLVVITGDLVDGFADQLADEVSPLADLRAQFGVYFVTGNHEYYFGVQDWLPILDKLGVQVLRNRAVPIGRGEHSFLLAGVDDYNAAGMAPGHGADLKRALADRKTEQEVILLAHQPRAVVEAAERDVGLVLSGHTHGGQIWPFTYLVALQQPYNKGLYQHGARTQIYVNQGTGVWGPPMRLGTESEITEIRLVRDDSPS